MALTRSIHFLKDHLSLGNFRDSYKEHVKIHIRFIGFRPVGNRNKFCKAIFWAGLGVFIAVKCHPDFHNTNTKYTNIPMTAVCVCVKYLPSFWSSVPEHSTQLHTSTVSWSFPNHLSSPLPLLFWHCSFSPVLAPFILHLVLC